MKSLTPQITIRNIPEPLRAYLNKKAQKSNKSLNQTVIDELSEQAGLTVGGKPQSLIDSLSWFIGSGMDQETVAELHAMRGEDTRQAAQEVAKLEDINQL